MNSSKIEVVRLAKSNSKGLKTEEASEVTSGCLGSRDSALGGAGLEMPPAVLAASPGGLRALRHTPRCGSLWGDWGHKESRVFYDMNTQLACFLGGSTPQ